MTTYALRHTPRPWVLCPRFDWRRHDACTPIRATFKPDIDKGDPMEIPSARLVVGSG